MAERIPCEFFLIRYVPDTVKNEYVNIGVLLREADRPEESVLRLTRDWSRVRCMDEDVDTELLEALEVEIQQRILLGKHDFKPIMSVLEESFSNSIQMSEGRACLAESIALELDLLMQLYVESRKERTLRKKTSRTILLSSMRHQFEQAGVWGLMRKRIAASQYTRSGDPLKLDCGYQHQGIVHFFHAVSLAGDLDVAKGLAFATASLRDGVRRIEQADLALTAVVEPLRQIEESGDEDGLARYQFGVEAMQDFGIRVLTTHDMPAVALVVQSELVV